MLVIADSVEEELVCSSRGGVTPKPYPYGRTGLLFYGVLPCLYSCKVLLFIVSLPRLRAFAMRHLTRLYIVRGQVPGGVTWVRLGLGGFWSFDKHLRERGDGIFAP